LVKGVIAESGSRAGHFATVCREFGIPLLLGIGGKIEVIKTGTVITLSAETKKVYEGEFGFPAQQQPEYMRCENLPFFRKLRSLLDFVTPLRLVDPLANNFVPESCRSLHDIIRFCHEKAVGAMFSVGDQAGRSKGLKKKLVTKLPFDVFLVDIDNGIQEECKDQQTVTIDNIVCTPFLPLWTGLTHPSIEWGDKTYYDWKNYDKMAMSDAFAFQSDTDSASYAVLGKHYLNINMRFGYHFTVVDTLCEPNSNSNYCSIRFAGGGGEFEGRELRISFLSQVLERLDFEVTIKGDLLDANISHVSQELLKQRLTSLGRLLGLTKQMDIHLHDISEVEIHIQHFFKSV
jgi:pyruvate,water dikinase